MKDQTPNEDRASLVQRLFVLLGALLAFDAHASFHTFKINEIYSSADGSVQFIELRESLGFNGENFLAGHFIQCVSGTMTNTFIFPTNLPPNTANKTCIIGTANLVSIPGGVRPDYVFTNAVPFIFSNSGSINYAGVDSVSYANLPADGVASLVRSGSSMVLSAINSPVDFDGVSNSIVPVRFTSTSLGGTTLSLTFLTAMGTNGTAGPNYEVQTNGSMESTVWGTVTNAGGNGTPMTVDIPITPHSSSSGCACRRLRSKTPSIEQLFARRAELMSVYSLRSWCEGFGSCLSHGYVNRIRLSHAQTF